MPLQAAACGRRRIGLDLDRPGVQHRELAHRGDRLLAVGQTLGALGVAGRQDLGDVASGEGRGHAAGGLDLLELGPAGPGQRVGQGLDVEGAAGRVVDAPDVDLLGEDDAGVAGDPADEVVGQAEGGAERQGRDGVGAADSGGEGGDRAAQDVDVGILAGQLTPARDGALTGAALVLVHAEDLADPRPARAERAQPGDGEELVVGGGDAELDRPEGLVDVDALLDECTHVLGAGGQRPGELGHVAGAGIVVDRRVDGDRIAVRVGGGAPDPFAEPRQVGGGAPEGGQAGGVDAEVEEDVVLGPVGGLVDGQERLGGGLLVLAGGDLDLRHLEEHVGEHLGHVGGPDGIGADAQPDGGDAALEIGEDRLAGEGRIGILVESAHVPGVGLAVADGGAAGEGGDPGIAQWTGDVIAPVHRLDVDAVDGVDRQTLHALLEGQLLLRGTTTVENLGHLDLPLLLGGCREIAGETELRGRGLFGRGGARFGVAHSTPAPEGSRCALR